VTRGGESGSGTGGHARDRHRREPGIGLAEARALATEVAEVVAFLASPRSVGITGDAVAVGGGVPGHVYN